MHEKDRLLEALSTTRERTLALIDSLSEDQLLLPYHPGVNPPLWEVGHAAFFYEVFILAALDGQPSFDPAMDDLWDSFHIEHRDRWQPGLFPGREQTRHYFNVVYDRIQARLESHVPTAQEVYLYRYAILHQNMHIESMIWGRQTVGYQAPPSCNVVPLAGVDETSGDVAVPAGTYVMGMPVDSPDFATTDFAFDNEKPRYEVELDGFQIARTLVSNGDFLQFIASGGYERPEFWSFGGRKWLRTERDVALVYGQSAPVMEVPRHPVYWRYLDGHWQEKLFDQWLPLDRDYPVTHVSYWEAEAYCNWAGRRLPTEQEWEAAALGNRPGSPFRRFPWGNEPDPSRVDMDARQMAQLPVSALPDGEGPFGCRQMLGTVWEWTDTQFLPYDGFTVDVYPYMSTLQFGDHKVTKGGSCATSSMLIRGTYRQAYLPQRSDVYTGFRTCAL